MAALALHELPSARGCTYVVPAGDYALALKLGQGFGEAQEVAQTKKRLGVTDAELERLCRAVLEALADFRVPETPQLALVSSLDGVVLLRRSVASLLDAADAALRVFSEKGTRALGELTDLPSHPILDRGRLVGLWEDDVEAGAVAWAAFGKPAAPRASRRCARRAEGRALRGPLRAASAGVHRHAGVRCRAAATARGLLALVSPVGVRPEAVCGAPGWGRRGAGCARTCRQV